MKFSIYQAPFAETAMGFAPTAEYRKVWDGEIEQERADKVDPDVLERIFAAFQRVDDDRMPPEGYEGRSLSVGDVVVLDGWAAYAVATTGFFAVGEFCGRDS